MKRMLFALLAGALIPIVSFSQTVTLGAEIQPVQNYAVEYDEHSTSTDASSLWQEKFFNIAPMLFWQYTNSRGGSHLVKIGYMRERYFGQVSYADQSQTRNETFEEVWHNVYLKYGYGQQGMIGPVRFDFGLEVPVVLHPADDFTDNYTYNSGTTTQTDVAVGHGKFSAEFGLGAFLFLHTKIFGHLEGGIDFNLDYSYWKRTYNITETSTYTDSFGNTNTYTGVYKDTFKTFYSTQFFPSLVLAYRLERPGLEQ